MQLEETETMKLMTAVDSPGPSAAVERIRHKPTLECDITTAGRSDNTLSVSV